MPVLRGFIGAHWNLDASTRLRKCNFPVSLRRVAGRENDGEALSCGDNFQAIAKKLASLIATAGDRVADRASGRNGATLDPMAPAMTIAEEVHGHGIH